MLKARSFVRQMSTATTLNLKNPSLLRNQCYVNGQWVDSKSGTTFEITDPATSKVIGTAPEMSVDDVRGAVTNANEAFTKFKTTSNRDRANLIRKWANLMRDNHEDLAKILTLENGKPLAEAKGEVMSSIVNFEWFAEEAPRIYGETIPSQDASKRIHTIRQPVGVCGIITPWNFPSSMISRKVGAALAAGCTTVIKPADATPYSALALAELADQAGVPPGVINVLTAGKNVKDIGKEFCENPDIKKVTFTGSTPVGKVLMQQSASTVKKVSFELGGSAPFIVLPSADIDAAVEGAMASKFRGSGQTCICADRFFVHEDVHDEFVAKFVKRVEQLKVGNGFEDGVTQGPLTNTASVDKVHSHVTNAVENGAKLHTGGKKLDNLGTNFYAPTILTGITPNMQVSCEETFGPIAAISKFSTEEEVIKLANNIDVGLAAYFYSRDVSQVNRVAEALEVGMVGVNTGMVTESALPFGGVKQSGFGREGSLHGVSDYVVIKSVVTQV